MNNVVFVMISLIGFAKCADKFFSEIRAVIYLYKAVFFGFPYNFFRYAGASVKHEGNGGNLIYFLKKRNVDLRIEAETVDISDGYGENVAACALNEIRNHIGIGFALGFVYDVLLLARRAPSSASTGRP